MSSTPRAKPRRSRGRTIKGAALFGGTAAKVVIRSHPKDGSVPWLCVYECYPDGKERFIGSIDGVTALRRFAEGINDLLPPKRGSS